MFLAKHVPHFTVNGSLVPVIYFTVDGEREW